MSLSDAITTNDETLLPPNFIHKEDVKEFLKKVEFRMLKKFQMASVPIMKIIKEEAGDKLNGKR